MIQDTMDWYQSLTFAEQVFCLIGGLSNILFLGYIILQWAGTDHDAHFDDADFTIFSIRGLLSFGMFMGWTALVASRQGVGLFAALALGLASGWLAAWLAWRLIRTMMRLQSSGTLDLNNAYGQRGTVYLTIPVAGQGSGKILVTVQGAQRELNAISESEALSTGTEIIVTGIRPGPFLVVAPLEPLLWEKSPMTAGHQ